jgi:prolyl-tRNA synthetase
MRQSQLFYKTEKETPKTAEIHSHQLLIRADFIDQLASGVYSFLPLGCRVLKKIEDIIRDEMEKIGGQELFLPTLQPKKIWKKTGRWESMTPPLFKLKDRHKKEFALGPTHEEVITNLAKGRIVSYKDLPIYLFQIQNKFRNELRSTGGLLRTREFLMKDLYSFHRDRNDLIKYFQKVLKSYDKIFKRCNLKAIKSQASGGAFTEKEATTYEFQVPSVTGEDKIVFCKKCKLAKNYDLVKGKKTKVCPNCKGKLEEVSTIETGHCFQLEEKYSKALDLYFFDKAGKRQLVTMGCYGIGLGRLMGTIAEVHHDEKGIIWPMEVAPFLFHLVLVGGKKAKVKGFKVYKELQSKGIDVLVDDREKVSPGEKFAEADLIGVPYRIVISERTLKKDCAEIKRRGKRQTKLVKLNKLIQFLKSKI